MTITAAADGSSLANPGPSGWAWYVNDDCWHAGGWPHGTNNMGELMAVLDLLQQTADTDDDVLVLCDSQYVINSVTKWMPGWKRNGWKKADKKPVLNVELLQELDLALQGRKVRFEWVKGHAGHELNEAADNRARAAATAYRDGTAVLVGPGFSPAGIDAASPRSPRTPPAVDGRSANEPDNVNESDEQPQAGQPASQRTLTESDPQRSLSGPDSERSLRKRRRRESAGTTFPTADDLAEVVALEQELLEDQTRADSARSGALLHRDFMEIGSSGKVWSRDEMLQSLAPLGNPLTVEVIDCSAVDADTILLLWRATGRGWTVNRSSLWVRTGDGWQLRFHQGTRA